MLLKYSKTRAPYFILFLVLVCLLILANNFGFIINEVKIPETLSSHSLFYDWMLSQNFFVNIALGIVMILEAIFLSRLNYKYRFIKERTSLPSIVFIVLISSTVIKNGFSPILFSILFILLTLDKLFSIYKSSKSVPSAFEAGFMLGIASLVYLPISCFILWLLVSLLVLNIYQIKAYFASILGFVSPFMLAYTVMLYKEIDVFDLLNNLDFVFTEKFQLPNLNYFQISYLAFILIITFISIFHVLNAYDEKKNSSRKYLLILLCFFILSVIIDFVFKNLIKENILLSFIPLTYILCHYFQLRKHKWLPELYYSCFVLLGVLVLIFS
ncbi:MAG: DUF6427 family protein [Marinifilaceae bacterium]|jgi:hypothetical protein|nr:DUF6427 family protein [Marinifilaceae bacterium]